MEFAATVSTRHDFYAQFEGKGAVQKQQQTRVDLDLPLATGLGSQGAPTSFAGAGGGGAEEESIPRVMKDEISGGPAVAAGAAATGVAGPPVGTVGGWQESAQGAGEQPKQEEQHQQLQQQQEVSTPLETSQLDPRAPVRKGKWTPEEEMYTTRIINDFNKGLLPLAPGTTLRSYLSEKLNW